MDDMERNQLIAVVVVIVVIGAAGAYILLAPPAVQLAEDQNIVNEVIGLPQYLDPHKDYESAGSDIAINVYETLFWYDFDSTSTDPTEPMLATGVTISADGLTYTFTLRQGVKFHDGTDFNATAVQMNFWRMLGRGWDDGFGPVWMVAEPILGGQAVEDAVFEYGDLTPEHTAAWENWVENVSAVVVTGDYEVEIHLAYAYAPFIAAITYCVGSMISPTFFMAHGGMSPVSDDFYLDDHMCGTGPYVFSEWVQDDRVVVTRNENYWRKDAAKTTHPYAGTIESVTWKKDADYNSRRLNLEAGTIDQMDPSIPNAYDFWNNVTNRDAGRTQSLNPEVKLWTGLQTYNIMFLGFNMLHLINQSNTIVQNPFELWNVRSAISYAFDYNALITNIMNGIASQLQGVIPFGMFGHDNDLYMYHTDLASAVTAWNDAMDEGLDDILANLSYTLTIYYNEGNDAREASSLLVKQAIDNIIADPASTDPSQPLTINAQAVEWASYLYQLRNRQLPIFFLGWAPDYADPDNYVGPFVKSTGTYPYRMGLDGSKGENGVLWNTAQVDGWISQAAQSSDPTTRENLYVDIQEAIVAHNAFIFGYQSNEFHLEGAWMNGYQFNAMHNEYYYHYYKVANY
jgi:peptide/nickel transport system substrate-binding protein